MSIFFCRYLSPFVCLNYGTQQTFEVEQSEIFIPNGCECIKIRVEMRIITFFLLTTLAGLVASQSLVLIGGNLLETNADVYSKIVELAVSEILLHLSDIVL